MSNNVWVETAMVEIPIARILFFTLSHTISRRDAARVQKIRDNLQNAILVTDDWTTKNKSPLAVGKPLTSNVQMLLCAHYT